jgi:transposase
MAAYSMDLRERVVAACDEGMDSRAGIAERFSVSESWIRRVLQRRRENGSIAPRPRGGGKSPAFVAKASARLREAVAAHPDATLKELAVAAGVASQVSVRGNPLWRRFLEPIRPRLGGRRTVQERPEGLSGMLGRRLEPGRVSLPKW